MSIVINFRRRIKHALQLFREGTPKAYRSGQKSMIRCSSEMSDEVTISGCVWGGIIHALTDSIFYTNNNFLDEVERKLAGEWMAPELIYYGKNAYLHEMQPQERAWYDALDEAIQLMVELNPQTLASTRERHRQLVEQITTLSSQIHYNYNRDDDSIARLVLGGVSSIVVRMDFITYEYSGQYHPNPSYQVFLEGYAEEERFTKPDYLPDLLWAQKVLRALRGESFLSIFCFYKRPSVCLVIR